MKLAIGINIFKQNKRQNFCIEVLKKLKNKFSNISLYNITFPKEINMDEEFIHLPELKQSAKDIINKSNSNKPIAKQFFNILSKQNCDYFVFLNSDIILSPKFIELLLKKEYETYCVSRYDTLPIESLTEIKPYRIEIAGFDVWAIKKQWWIDYSFLFKDYIYAEHLWDVDYTLTMYNHSKCLICNKLPYAFHEKHELNWTENSLEAKYNYNLWNQTPYYQRWHNFIYENLIKREPYGQFLYPLPNENDLEHQILKIT